MVLANCLDLSLLILGILFVLFVCACWFFLVVFFFLFRWIFLCLGASFYVIYQFL